MKFRLTGKVYWAVGSCHDDRSEIIDIGFVAIDEKRGIEEARRKVQKFHEKYSWNTDYGLSAELCVGKRSIWTIYHEDDKPAVPAVPARPAKPARPAVPAHFVEKRFYKKKS